MNRAVLKRPTRRRLERLEAEGCWIWFTDGGYLLSEDGTPITPRRRICIVLDRTPTPGSNYRTRAVGIGPEDEDAARAALKENDAAASGPPAGRRRGIERRL